MSAWTFGVLLLLSWSGFIHAVPQILTFDKVATLYEGITTNAVLSSIECTDTAGAATTVALDSVSPTNPCTNCFEILQCGTNECLQYRAGVGTLNHQAQNLYLITVACRNNVDPEVTEVIQVVVTPNSPPYFDPDVLFVSNPISAVATGAGTLIYDVNAIDDEGDALTYSFTVTPATSAGNYNIDPLTGQITSTVDLRAECETKSVTFEVMVSDGTSSTGPLVVDVPFTNANSPPHATNLNTVVQFPEDAAVGTDFKMNFVDSSAPSALTYTITSSNPAGWAQFSQVGNDISVASALDYEQSALRQTNLQITASDGYCTSEQYTLRLEVTDVNEEPTITPTNSALEVCEGERTFDPQLTVVDEDAVDTRKWTQTSTNNFGWYSIDPVNGVLGTTHDYDLDPDPDKGQGVRPATKAYVVQVEDKGGLTATATVTVTFVDCNDNAPRFPQASYVASATECAAAGSILRSITATDADSAREQNNVITYSGSGGAVSVGSGGDIILNSALPAGSVINFDVYATDQGQTPGPLRSENPAKVSVNFLPCPTTQPPVTAAATTTTTTTTVAAAAASSSGGGDNNLIWIIVAAILGVLMLALLAFMLWRYGSLCWRACENINCRKRCCKPRPKRPVRPRQPDNRGPAPRPYQPQPPPEEKIEKEPPGPAFLFGFWKERYPNDDFKQQPDRKRLPTPADMEQHYPHTNDLMDPLDQPTTPEPPPKKSKCTIL